MFRLNTVNVKFVSECVYVYMCVVYFTYLYPLPDLLSFKSDKLICSAQINMVDSGTRALGSLDFFSPFMHVESHFCVTNLEII